MSWISFQVLNREFLRHSRMEYFWFHICAYTPLGVRDQDFKHLAATQPGLSPWCCGWTPLGLSGVVAGPACLPTLSSNEGKVIIHRDVCHRAEQGVSGTAAHCSDPSSSSILGQTVTLAVDSQMIFAAQTPHMSTGTSQQLPASTPARPVQSLNAIIYFLVVKTQAKPQSGNSNRKVFALWLGAQHIHKRNVPFACLRVTSAHPLPHALQRQAAPPLGAERHLSAEASLLSEASEVSVHMISGVWTPAKWASSLLLAQKEKGRAYIKSAHLKKEDIHLVWE